MVPGIARQRDALSVTTFIRQLECNGPDRVETFSECDARAWALRQATSHYENFSVLSSLVPRDRREDLAAIYAFCRWADDLADEVHSPGRSLELLQWWRRELAQCFAGEPRHPVFIALAPTIRRHDLPIEPFEALIGAFEQDQRVTRYDTWEQLLGYCRGSADPVGRLVLMVLGEGRDAARFELSDAVCTALQLTNHWQDVRRDILERDRVYIPVDMIRGERFDERLRRSAAQGWAVDGAFLEESRQTIRACVNRTWPLFEKGEGLLDLVSSRARPIIWLFIAGGEHVLHRIETWNYETALHRPTLGRLTKARLVFRAWRRSRRRGASSPPRGGPQ